MENWSLSGFIDSQMLPILPALNKAYKKITVMVHFHAHPVGFALNILLETIEGFLNSFSRTFGRQSPLLTYLVQSANLRTFDRAFNESPRTEQHSCRLKSQDLGTFPVPLEDG